MLPKFIIAIGLLLASALGYAASSDNTFSFPADSKRIVVIEKPTIAPMSAGTSAFFTFIIAPQMECRTLSVYFGYRSADGIEQGSGNGVAFWSGSNTTPGQKFQKETVVPYSPKGNLYVKKVTCITSGGVVESNSNS